MPHRGRPVPLRDATPQAPQLDRARRHLARGALPRGRTRDRRQDQHARARDQRHNRATRLRRDAQPVGPHPFAGRVERRVRGRGRGGHGCARARQRHGRLDPVPGVDVRHRRAEADAGRARPSVPTSASTGDRSPTSSCSTRSIRDTALVLDAVAGPGTGDPYSAPPPARPFRDEVGAPPGRLRIGLRTRRRDGQRKPSRLRARGRGRGPAARIARPPRGARRASARSTSRSTTRSGSS